MRLPVDARLLVLLAPLWAGACPVIDHVELDLELPTVVSVTPSGNAVPVEATFTVRFSEAVLRRSIFWVDPETGVEHPDSVGIVAVDDEEYAVSALDNPPLSATQRAKILPATVTLLADRRSLTVQPAAPLEGLKTYALLLSRKITDDHNNPIVVRPRSKESKTQAYEFTTVSAPDLKPPTAALVSPPAGATGVALDLAKVQVQFEDDVDPATVSAATVGLVERDTQIALRPVEVTLDGTLATLRLPTRGGATCVTLCLGKTYDLWVSDSVADLAGNPFDEDSLPGQAFSAANCLDVTAPRIDSTRISAVPLDVSAVVAWVSDEPSDSKVEWVAGDGAAFAAACTPTAGPGCNVTVGPDAVCAVDLCALPEDPAQFACAHAVRLDGLSDSTVYTFRAASADAGGRTARTEARSFTTLAPQAKVVLSEVLASPKGLSSLDAGKFVEVYNPGPVEADLTGWKLARCIDDTCATIDTTLELAAAGASAKIPVGAYAVVAGAAFNATAMGVPAGTVMLKGKTGTTLSLLRKTYKDSFALQNPAGAIVSKYGSWLGKPGDAANDGKSFERKDPAGADEALNWALSTAAVAGAAGTFATPGAKNSATP